MGWLTYFNPNSYLFKEFVNITKMDFNINIIHQLSLVIKLDCTVDFSFEGFYDY